jgi:hypothetical protein
MSLSQGITCSKWWNSNVISNWTVINFICIVLRCWNLQIAESMGATLKIVFTTNFGIAYTTCHLQSMRQTSPLRSLRKTRTVPNLSPL